MAVSEQFDNTEFNGSKYSEGQMRTKYEFGTFII
jgi:hypothetical protein